MNDEKPFGDFHDTATTQPKVTPETGEAEFASSLAAAGDPASPPAASVAPLGTPAQPPPEEPEAAVQLHVSIDSWSAVTYAYAHNRIPVVRALRLEVPEGGPSGLLKIDVEMTWSREAKPPAKPVSLTVEAPEPGGDPLTVRDVGLKLDDTVLVDLEESVPAMVRVRVRAGDTVEVVEEHDLRVLARNQWFLRTDYGDALAAYVQPNHPVTKEVLSKAAEILKERTGSASIEGYQAGAERAIEIGRAVYETLQSYGLTYVNPPASFETSQKVRPLDEVLEGRSGTCIDLACAYASCLEQAGLRPVIWLVPGHAFAGFLTVDEALPASVVTDANTILMLRDAKITVPVETVGLTDGTSFEEAGRTIRTRFTTSAFESRLGFLIDVHRAHRAGTLPLPARVVRDEVVTIVVDPGPGRVPVVERRERSTGRLLPEEVPPRIKRWQASLLDLSLRNPLLNFSTRRRGLDILVPPGAVGRIEDDLHSGSPVVVQPGDVLEGTETAAGLRNASEMAGEALAALYDRLHLLYAPAGEAEGKKRIRWLGSRAKLIEGETGANNLYLALGTLTWNVGPKEVTSPLYLVPVRMRRPKGTSLIGLEADENGFTTPNYCLAEKLKAEYKLEIPAYESPDEDDAGIDIDAGLAAVRAAVLERGLPFRVDEGAHLAILHFSTFRLWKDMSDHWKSFLDNPVVKHMVETPGQPFVDPAAQEGTDAEAAVHEAQVHAPVPLDGSQLRAVARAAAGHSFVLEGPPGTGKSQTITNLLAHALATGKTVLFVAEKQAALSVVKDRLASVGLDPYCLDLHDKGSSPNEIREQLRHALDHRPETDLAKHEETSRALRSVHDRLAAYRDALYAANAFDHSFAHAHRRLLDLGDGPAAEIPRSFLEQEPDVVRRVETVLLESAPAVLGARPDREHPWRFVSAGDFGSVDRAALAERVGALAEARDRLGDPEGPVADALRHVASTEDLRDVALLVTAAAEGAVPGAAHLERLVDEEWEPAFETAVKNAEAAVEAAANSMRAYGRELFARPVASFESARTALAEASQSFFLVRGRRLRSALATLLDRDDVPKLKAAEAVVLGERLVRERKALEEARRSLEAVGGVRLDPAFRPEREEALIEIRAAGARDARIAHLLARTDALGAAARTLAASTEPLPPGIAGRFRTLATNTVRMLDAVDASPKAFAAWLGSRGLLAALDGTLEAWRQDAEEARFLSLQRWIQLHAALEPLRTTGLHRLEANILDGEVPANEADVVFRRGLLRASARERAETLRLDTFDSVAHEQVVDRYLDLTSVRRGQLQEVIPVKLNGSRSFNPASGYGAVNDLRIELQRKRGAKSVRNLIARFPELIQQLTPCFLMSPDSVAKFIPAGELTFDMVVFDEASQIDLAEAVGAMGRARSVVVVGDSKQMPPTRFGVADGSGDDLFTETDGEDELPEDGESLLIEAVDTGLDQEWLSWHYRSRDESLIAFSNRHYYEDRLASFPTPRTQASEALRWIKVEGQYEHSGRRVNEVEAAAVADEVVRRVNDPSTTHQTIGVITLNAQQQGAIKDMLEACGDARILDLLESEDEEGIFVRNLESVQGHERDVILFSTGFSKKADGSRMPLNFGPLNRAGGERRLNVAVTRARQEVVIFSSFEPEEIDDRRTSALGLLHLREYLRMAKHGVEPVDEGEDELARDLHRDDVRSALEARGLRVASDVGLSPFRVDLAVSKPGAEEWHVAVLLDGPRWHRRATVGDRDGLPVNVLQNLMGWPRIARIWLPSWQVERERIVDQVARLVDEAVEEAAKGAAEPVASVASGTGSTETPRPQSAPMATQRPRHATGNTSGTSHAAFLQSTAPSRAASDPADGLPRFEPYPDGPPLGISDDWTLDFVKANVRQALMEAIEREGPVEERRLAKLVAGRFGIGRLHPSRAEVLLSEVARGCRREGPFGTFVWPESGDPKTYPGFRVSPDDAVRSVEEIAPEEVVNAMRHVAREALAVERDELVRAVAALFGFKRVTKGIEGRLQNVLRWALTQGRLTSKDGSIRPPDAAA